MLLGFVPTPDLLGRTDSSIYTAKFETPTAPFPLAVRVTRVSREFLKISQ